jgi:succinylglutamate desuccinylase
MSSEAKPQTSKIQRVLVVGGTHGNERTGVYVVKAIEQNPAIVSAYSFEVIPLLANPQAIAANTRYIDRDLNRCFDKKDVANPELLGVENQLAKEYTAKFGADGTESVDVIIDTHTSTANTGQTIIPISNSPENLRLAAYLADLDPTIRVHLGLHSQQDSPMLRSLATLGCTIEVGPIPQGILDAKIFQYTKKLLLATLDYCEQLRQGITPATSGSLTLYQAIDTIDYPRNGQGDLTAMIHADRQGQDYQPMNTGDPLFYDLQGQTIAYEGSQTVYPVFINEAAYYEKGIAMVITEKQTITISE